MSATLNMFVIPFNLTSQPVESREDFEQFLMLWTSKCPSLKQVTFGVVCFNIFIQNNTWPESAQT